MFAPSLIVTTAPCARPGPPPALSENRPSMVPGHHAHNQGPPQALSENRPSMLPSSSFVLRGVLEHRLRGSLEVTRLASPTLAGKPHITIPASCCVWPFQMSPYFGRNFLHGTVALRRSSAHQLWRANLIQRVLLPASCVHAVQVPNITTLVGEPRLTILASCFVWPFDSS